MNWTEYKIMSEKTLSTDFYCSKTDELLLHAAIGIATELEEIMGWDGDSVGKMEEIADVCWYLAIISRECNLDFPTIDFVSVKSESEILIDMFKKTSLILDILKKKIFYNKPIDSENFICISREIMILAGEYFQVNNIDMEKSLDINIAKLKKRYGHKFSSEKAINRDLKAEREILEGKPPSQS